VNSSNSAPKVEPMYMEIPKEPKPSNPNAQTTKNTAPQTEDLYMAMPKEPKQSKPAPAEDLYMAMPKEPKQSKPAPAEDLYMAIPKEPNKSDQANSITSEPLVPPDDITVGKRPYDVLPPLEDNEPILNVSVEGEKIKKAIYGAMPSPLNVSDTDARLGALPTPPASNTMSPKSRDVSMNAGQESYKRFAGGKTEVWPPKVITGNGFSLCIGTCILNEAGSATITLPTPFVQSSQGKYHYSLTPIGKQANVFISQEVSNGVFQVSGGSSNLQVSWQVFVA